MMGGNEEPIDRETYDLISKSLSHPIRRKLLRFLKDKGKTTFTQLCGLLGIDGSHLSYHISQMGELLKKAEDGSYELSTLGFVAVSLMRDVEELSSEESLKRRAEAETKKPAGLTLLYILFAIMGIGPLVALGILWPLFSPFLQSILQEQLPLVVVSWVVSSVVSLAIAFGLRKSEGWGWWSAMSFLAGNSVATSLTMLSFPPIPSFILSVVVLVFYLVCLRYLNKNRRWFPELGTVSRRTLAIAIGIGLFPLFISSAMRPPPVSTFVEPTPPLISVKGEVTDISGTPLSAGVYFQRTMSFLGGRLTTPPVAFSLTDQRGKFEISLPEGLYLVKTYSLGHNVSEDEIHLNNNSLLTIKLPELNATMHDLKFQDVFNHTLSLSELDRQLVVVCTWGSAQSIPIKDYLLILNRIRQSFTDTAAFVIFKTTDADETPDSLAANGDLSWIVEKEGLSWENLPERERSLFYDLKDGKVRIPVPNTVVLDGSRQEVLRSASKSFIAKVVAELAFNGSLPFIRKFEQSEVNGTTRLYVEVLNPSEKRALTIRVECRKYVFGLTSGLETTYQLAIPFDSPYGTTRLAIDLGKLYRGEMLLVLLDGNRLIDIEETSTYSFSLDARG